MKRVTLDNNGLAAESGMMTVYSYDPETGLCTGSSYEYLTQGVGIPANSTSDAPPVSESGKVCVYIDGSWLQKDDHRGETVYSVSDGSAIEIAELGDYPAGVTLIEPATVWDKWDGEKWVTDADAQQAADVKSAAGQKSALISEANGVTQAWQTQLLLGIITDEDKASLTEWMKYIQAVQAVNVQEAPTINWPQKPQ
ncbi:MULTISPECIES: tail fiber assembly protein [Pantoea]|uniref:tail fiber assembly protein n=1 Tax=Pantoea TaxID=53335 RepID=UPI00177AC55A|nr:tail fiber assembly protein [Pantoea endophytica]MBD9660861.1 tail fiber assembly protein [Pantoea sp. PNT03]